MTNLPKALRQQLAQQYLLTVPQLERKQRSKQDGTVKFLWRLHDGNTVESVLMHYSYGASLCISTQVGCRMGCTFCASTLGGLVRNLQAGEMLDQVLFAQKEEGVRISHIVLMGMGEPLDNYEQVVRFLRLVSHPDGLQVSLRHISLSTCGPGRSDRPAWPGRNCPSPCRFPSIVRTMKGAAGSCRSTGAIRWRS